MKRTLNLAVTLLAATASHALACDTQTAAQTALLPAPVVIAEPFAVPVATVFNPAAGVAPSAIVTPTIVTPTIVTPLATPTVVVKEVVRPRGRVFPRRGSVQVTRTITRSR